MQRPKNIALFCTGSHAVIENDAKQIKAFLKEKHSISTIFSSDTDTYLPAEERAEIFLNYLFNPDIDILWALRGGEGSADVIPFLHEHKAAIKTLKPKPIIGFSDITAMLLYFEKHYRWPVIHGPGLSQLCHNRVDSLTQKTAFELMLKNTPPPPLELTSLNAPANENTNITALLTGGNLSLINISIQDRWEIDGRNKIIILEDVNEKPHAIARTLKYLQRIGMFEGAKAIIFGDFAAGEDADAYLRRLRQFAETLTIPALYTDQIGHGTQNIAFQLNTPYTLALENKQARLTHQSAIKTSGASVSA